MIIITILLKASLPFIGQDKKIKNEELREGEDMQRVVTVMKTSLCVRGRTC